MKLKMENLSQYLPSNFRIKSILIPLLVRLVNVLIGFLIYILFPILFPITAKNILEISLLLAIIISIVFITPFQENLELLLKKKFLSEYIFEDSLTLQYARRKFEIKSLVSNIFPDMVKLSGSSSGKLAILTPKDNRFEFYSFEKGKRKKIKSGTINISTTFLKFLKDKINGISNMDLIDFRSINQELISYQSNFVLPFLYRDKVFGFLALQNIPQEEELQTLKVLASKSALAIHNHILSSQIALNKKYKKELEVASRIEKLIFSTKIPEFKNIIFNNYNTTPNTLLEFFDGANKEHLFVIIIQKGFEMFSEILFSHILGRIYSLTFNEVKYDIKTLRNNIERILREYTENETIEFIIGGFNDIDHKVTFFVSGKYFRISSESSPSLSLVSSGWKYTLDLNETSNIIIYHSSEKLFSLEPK